MATIKLFAFADEAGAPLSSQIAAMQRNHLQGLEIRNVEGRSISDIPVEEARLIRSRLDDAGLVTWSIGSPIDKIRFDQDWNSHLDKLRHTLELASILGAENLRMFSFFIPKGEAPANYSSLVVDRLGQMLELAKGSGISLLHENEKGIYGDIASRCLELHRQLPELKGVFDPANFVQCGQDTLEAWALLKEYITYLHIKDATAQGYVVPAGKGIGNIAAIVKDYLSRGGSAITLEPHLTTFAGLKKLEEAGNVKHIGKEFTYPTADDAFDAACAAFQGILEELQ